MISSLISSNKTRHKLDKRINKPIIRKKLVQETINVSFIVNFIHENAIQWNSEELRQFLLKSLIKLFGVIRISAIVFTINELNNKHFEIVVNSKNKEIVYTALCLIDDRVKPNICLAT